MNSKENRIHEALVRIRNFGTSHASEFAADSLGKQTFTTLAGVVSELDGHAARESAGIGRQHRGTADRSEAREELRDLVESISGTSEVLGPEFSAVADQFGLPPRKNDRALLNAARGFATELVPFVAQFEAHELPGLMAKLNARIAALDAAIEMQDDGTADHVASRVAIDEVIDRGLELRRKLNMIVRNKYADDPEVLAEWTSVSHIERGPVRKKDEAPPTPVSPSSPSPASPSPASALTSPTA